MALHYSTTLRDARLDQLTSAAGSAAILTIYEGTPPAPGGTATTPLVALTCGSPLAPASSGGVLTLSGITNGTASATGTATWARITTSGGVFVVDMLASAAGGGGDLILASTAISAGTVVSITSAVITEGNN